MSQFSENKVFRACVNSKETEIKHLKKRLFFFCITLFNILPGVSLIFSIIVSVTDFPDRRWCASVLNLEAMQHARCHTSTQIKSAGDSAHCFLWDDLSYHSTTKNRQI